MNHCVRHNSMIACLRWWFENQKWGFCAQLSLCDFEKLLNFLEQFIFLDIFPQRSMKQGLSLLVHPWSRHSAVGCMNRWCLNVLQ